MIVASTQVCGVPARIAFCQLETHSTDKRTWKREESEAVSKSAGRQHRTQQVLQICRYFKRDKNVILMGDFNARPGVEELQALRDEGGFKQVLPHDWPEPGRGEDRLAPNYVYGPRAGAAPHYHVHENRRNRPYSHLTHRILIDHAFVKGFEQAGLSFRLEVLKLPHELPGARGGRITDHRPIALFVKRERRR